MGRAATVGPSSSARNHPRAILAGRRGPQPYSQGSLVGRGLASRFIGCVWRHIPSGGHPLNTRYILRARGRWNRESMYGCLYTALDVAGALAELRKLLLGIGMTGLSLKARELVSIAIEVAPVLDLSSRSRRIRYGISLNSLRGDREQDLEACRKIADRARSEGYRAILAPSAARRSERVLIVYLEGVAEKLDIDVGKVRASIVHERPALPISGRVSKLASGAARGVALREVLLRSNLLNERYCAAYRLAEDFRSNRKNKKGMFYSRLAIDIALDAGQADWVAAGREQLGNLFLSESLIDQASEEYEQALALTLPASAFRRAALLDRLGYCRSLQNRPTEAFRLIRESLRLVRRLSAYRYMPEPLLSLAWFHMQKGRYSYALRHGLKALRIAELQGQTELVKNALYLVGESFNLAGDATNARERFSDLQRRFFPESTYLTGFLMAVDLRHLINLKA